jgi:hypothetical protein
VANVTAPLNQRKGDAEHLGDMMSLTPHQAWQLACSTAVALGFGPRTGEAWKQIVHHTLPGGFPSAEQWLQAAGLDDQGRDTSAGARPDPRVDDYGFPEDDAYTDIF